MRIKGTEPSSVILSQTCSLKLKNNDKKEEIWPSPMTKAPTPTEMSKGQKWQHK